MSKVRNLKHLKVKLENDKVFAKEFYENPQAMLESLDPGSHPKLFRIVLYFVGFALIFSLIIAAVIILSGPVELITTDGKAYTQLRSVDQFFVMIGSAAIGALAGLLVPSGE